jgi:flagellar protein FliS
MYGRNKYRQTQANTASPGELVVMLYDGIGRFVGDAITALEAEDVKELGVKTTRAIDIIAYLQSTLREDVAPELVAALDRVYCSWTAILVGANLDRDRSALDAVRTQAEDLRSAWEEARVDAEKKSAEVPATASLGR